MINVCPCRERIDEIQKLWDSLLSQTDGKGMEFLMGEIMIQF